MGLEEVSEPKSGWMAEFENRVESRGFSLRYPRVAAASHYFLSEGNTTYAVGKTHHTREKERARVVY